MNDEREREREREKKVDREINRDSVGESKSTNEIN
jgi:hypothetical protein